MISLIAWITIKNQKLAFASQTKKKGRKIKGHLPVPRSNQTEHSRIPEVL